MKKLVSQLMLQEGEGVRSGQGEYVITKIASLTKVIAKNLNTGKTEVLDVSTLFPLDQDIPDQDESAVNQELEQVSTEDWAAARRNLELIRPLLTRQPRGSGAVEKLSKESGISRATLYRWLQLYRNTGLLSSLLPVKRSGGRGKSRLSPEVEAIVKDRIQNYYLTDQQPSIKDTIDEIRRLCSNAGIPLPHPMTVRKRIRQIEEREKLQRRRGRRAAVHIYEPNEGSTPDAEWALAMVQIDHTPVNVMIVHEVTRQVIGRPWVTFAIDVHSRVVLGMYLTLDHPSAMSAGLCIVNAILPKERWLQELEVQAEWPCWGVMGILHMDNAREFRGDMLKVACAEYDIDLMLRPVKTPHYGGHIERLMGTVAQELKKLPGATFANPKERGEYDSEGKAIMTLRELESWMALFVAKYNHRVHSALGMSPLQKYEESLLGGNGRPPRGLPAKRFDEEKVRLDFMPFEERTVQPYGVLIDDIHYFADVLRPWVNATDPKNSKLKRVFRFKRDPRDISQLYFFDPVSEHYFAIPYRDSRYPAISLQELKEARKAAKSAGHKDLDERVIFQFINQQRAIEDQAAEKSKVARKKQQKRLNNAKVRKTKEKELPKTTATAKPAQPPVYRGYNPPPNAYFEEDD